MMRRVEANRNFGEQSMECISFYLDGMEDKTITTPDLGELTRQISGFFQK